MSAAQRPQPRAERHGQMVSASSSFKNREPRGAWLEMAHRGGCQLDHVEFYCPALEVVCYSKYVGKSLDHLVELQNDN